MKEARKYYCPKCKKNLGNFSPGRFFQHDDLRAHFNLGVGTICCFDCRITYRVKLDGWEVKDVELNDLVVE